MKICFLLFGLFLHFHFLHIFFSLRVHRQTDRGTYISITIPPFAYPLKKTMFTLRCTVYTPYTVTVYTLYKVQILLGVRYTP